MNDTAATAEPRYAVRPERMYDLSLTTIIAELANIPVNARASDWDERLLGALWNGSIEIADPAFFQGPDGFVYLRMQLPRPGMPFDSNCLSRQAGMLVETARGAALFDAADRTDPVYVLPMGVIDSMLRFDDHRGDPIDRREVALSPELAKDAQIRAGSS